MAESSGPRHGPQWRDTLVSELRALSPRLDVPPAAVQATTVRQRLEAQQRPEARPPLIARWRARILYPRWRAALIVALTVVVLAVALLVGAALLARSRNPYPWPAIVVAMPAMTTAKLATSSRIRMPVPRVGRCALAVIPGPSGIRRLARW